jgi:hypothetical protein
MTYKNVNYLLQFVSFANPGGNCGCKLLFFYRLNGCDARKPGREMRV